MYNALGVVTVWDNEQVTQGLIEIGTHLYRSLVTIFSCNLDKY